MYQFESDLCQMIPIEFRYQFESPWGEEHLVHQGGQMYDHIAYELKYENLS